jgi:hypothetical protein
MRDVFAVLALAGCITACEPRCHSIERVLATGDDGRAVTSYLDCSTSETINLISASGRKTAIFKYESSGGAIGCKGKTYPRAKELSPTVTWSDPHLIHISIGIIYSIDRKLDNVDGVRVIYDIGTVLSDVCQAGTS